MRKSLKSMALIFLIAMSSTLLIMPTKAEDPVWVWDKTSPQHSKKRGEVYLKDAYKHWKRVLT